MNLKPNQHKRISFNTTIMTPLGFIAPPNILGPSLNSVPPKFNFLLRSPQLFWSEIFRTPRKLGGVATMWMLKSPKRNTLADGLIERTSSILDETESKTVHKDEEGYR